MHEPGLRGVTALMDEQNELLRRQLQLMERAVSADADRERQLQALHESLSGIDAQLRALSGVLAEVAR